MSNKNNRAIPWTAELVLAVKNDQKWMFYLPMQAADAYSRLIKGWKPNPVLGLKSRVKLHQHSCFEIKKNVSNQRIYSRSAKLCTAHSKIL